jgi:subtilisin family serine protease
VIQHSRSALLGALLLSASLPALAQVDAAELVAAFERAEREGRGLHDSPLLPRAFTTARDGKVPVLVRFDSEAVRPPELVRVAQGLGALYVTPARLRELAQACPACRFDWSPPKRLLLDQASGFTRAAEYRASTGRTGRGVVIGVVDSGVDVAHPDLRTSDGRTRVLRLLDYSRGPMGLQPELERRYGCAQERDCAVLTGDDIDALLGNGVIGDEPMDDIGHGTHVASLAAGNGGPESRYIGVAPEADLIVARVTRSNGGSILDTDIMRAVGFVYEQAEELGRPVVANLSLGGDFGAHDGRSLLEESLASFVGDDKPGRAMVVAAGNSAGLLMGFSSAYPEPLGIHTEVHVPRGAEARVPLLSMPTRNSTTDAAVFVWISYGANDSMSVGFDDASGTWVEPLGPGQAGTFRRGEAELAVFNGKSLLPDILPVDGPSAVVALVGKWRSGTPFAIRLSGHGTARFWSQSDGDLGPARGGLGALFPAASKQGTVNIPASHPALIAVGATLNRVSWTDYSGALVEDRQHGALDDAPPDTTAYFSSAGPNVLGVMKPDIVAPGANVIAAMAALADPRLGAFTMFSGLGRCPSTATECMVVDDTHGVATGTSMAAPVVTGAIALLLEQDPTRTQSELRRLLQAGARKLRGVVFNEQQVGPGALDLVGVEAVLELEENGTAGGSASADRTQSWLALSSSFARPDGETPLVGVVSLRDASAKPVDPKNVELEAAPGTLRAPFTRVAPGQWRFELVAPPGSGQSTLSLAVLVNGERLLERAVPIAVDRSVSERGVVARGGCTLSRPSQEAWAPFGWLLVLAVLVGRARSRRREPSHV